MSFNKSILAAAAIAALPMLTSAEEGVTSTSIAFAQVAALEGPAAALGQGMRLGMQAAFEEANAAGGVHGRTITLDSMNDNYEPDRSVALVKSVVEGNNHLGLIGAVVT